MFLYACEGILTKSDLLLLPDREGSLAHAQKGLGVALNYSTNEVDQLAERARQHGANIVDGLVNRPWNVREFTVLDPDGYRLVFNAPLPDARIGSFEEVLDHAAKGF